MNSLTRFRHATAIAVAGALLLAATASASEESHSGLSANAGINTRFVYRGTPLANSAVFFGLDYENSGVYLETWMSEVGTGLETDFLAGFAGESGDFRYGIGATGYFFTDDFEDTYSEVNLSGGWKFLTLDVAIGRFGNFDEPSEDYTFFSAKVEHKGFYGLFGSFSQDVDGDYFEAGYMNSLHARHSELFGYSLSIIRSSKELAENVNEHTHHHEPDTFINFNITKHFSL